MAKDEELFRQAVNKKRLPPLVLDQEWHYLFTQVGGQDAKLASLSAQEMELIKRQGKLTTESKDIKKIKQRLMDEIVELAGDEANIVHKSTIKKLESNRRLIQDCNKKFDDYQRELDDIPKEIDEVNRELMFRSMQLCYDKLKENTDAIEEISAWLTEIKAELKKRVTQKQRMEKNVRDFYTFMHKLFGPEVINIFDIKNPLSEQGKPKGEEFSTEEKKELL